MSQKANHIVRFCSSIYDPNSKYSVSNDLLSFREHIIVQTTRTSNCNHEHLWKVR